MQGPCYHLSSAVLVLSFSAYESHKSCYKWQFSGSSWCSRAIGPVWGLAIGEIFNKQLAIRMEVFWKPHFEKRYSRKRTLAAECEKDRGDQDRRLCSVSGIKWRSTGFPLTERSIKPSSDLFLRTFPLVLLSGGQDWEANLNDRKYAESKILIPHPTLSKVFIEWVCSQIPWLLIQISSNGPFPLVYLTWPDVSEFQWGTRFQLWWQLPTHINTSSFAQCVINGVVLLAFPWLFLLFLS